MSENSINKEIEKEKRNMVECIKQIKWIIDDRKYLYRLFNSNNNDSETKRMRSFCGRLYWEAKNPEEFVDKFVERHKRKGF